MGMLAGFGDHGFIACEQVSAVGIIDETSEEEPVDGQPVDLGMKEALDGAITASFIGPSGDAELGDASGHGEHSDNDVMELPTSCFGQNGNTVTLILPVT